MLFIVILPWLTVPAGAILGALAWGAWGVLAGAVLGWLAALMIAAVVGLFHDPYAAPKRKPLPKYTRWRMPRK